jgi:hypothetical protein
MSGHENLRSVDGRKGLEHGFDGPGVNAIFGFFDEVNTREVRQEGGYRQSQQAQCAIGGHPGGYL